MKTNTLLCIIGLLSFPAFAQTNAATATISSGGLEAGVYTSGTGGNSFYGYRAGKVVASGGIRNTFIGHTAGVAHTSGDDNTFLGFGSGTASTTGSHNTFIGKGSGNNITAGIENTYVGYSTSGSGAGTSELNTFLGSSAGLSATGTQHNLFVGAYSGSEGSGNFNTYLGTGAGFMTHGTGNVLIGYSAGSQKTIDNKLYIDNIDNAIPLIWGDFSAASRQLKFNAKVGIGADSGFGNFPGSALGVLVNHYRLFVNGGILTEEVRVALGFNWADYVFAKDYDLKPLHEVEKFIAENGHLPNVPSAKQVREEGIELGEMAKIQQEKIEELTLYAIRQQKEIDELKKLVKALSEKN